MKRSGLATRSAMIALLLVTQGCADSTYRIGGYLWTPDPSSPTCEKVVWRQVEPPRVPGLCMDLEGRVPSDKTSCALGCVVISQFSEDEARRRMIYGESLYEHEARHVLERLVHPRTASTTDAMRTARM